MGRYLNQHLNGHAGLILNPRELDLRLFLNQWASVFAMSETNKRGVRHSIQFFDHQGDALHKVYTTEETDLVAWMALVERHLSTENPALALKAAAPTVSNAAPDAEKIDREWREMTDVHQFFQLLGRHKLTRQQAFRAVGNDLAYRVDNNALAQLLNAAHGLQNEIMIFVGNRGCVQIFTGQIERLMPQEGWINVFNRRFTLHLIEGAIAESWITRKPTKDGFVTSLELFAADGTQIAQLYGQRTEGQPEQTQWREQVAALEPKDIAA
jgi:putative hemin transport protein